MIPAGSILKRLAIRSVAALSILGAAGGAVTPAPGPPAAPPAVAIEALAGTDEAARFDAILNLVDSGDPGVDRLLEEARGTEPFSRPGAARLAIEFVRLKRAKAPAGGAGPPARKGKNVILISIDTLRADHLGCYGYHRRTSPTIDAMAKRGVLFERALSPSSWSLPVHMSMFTSLYPSFHGVERSGERWSVSLPDSTITLAQHLKEAGYVTASLVANPFLDAKWGFDRGFDLYRRYDVNAGTQSDRAALWLEWHSRRAGQGLAGPNFFLFLHYNDPHLPYSAPQAFRDKFPVERAAPGPTPPKEPRCAAPRPSRTLPDLERLLALYDAEVNYVDFHLGRFLGRLRDLGLDDSTLLILTSDHGEEFGDHGGTSHMFTLYDEMVRVPLIMADPRLIAPRQRFATPVSLLDILPTVLEAIGRETPARAQGINLLPHLRRVGRSAPASPPRSRPMFAELGPLGQPWNQPFHSKAVMTDTHKLIENHSKDGQVTREFYDLADDPRESCNAYDDLRGSEAIRRLEDHLVRFIREGLAHRDGDDAGSEFEMTDELRERLRSLGYID